LYTVRWLSGSSQQLLHIPFLELETAVEKYDSLVEKYDSLVEKK
jgi:hypothetical protein